MCDVSDTNRSYSGGEARGKDRDASNSFTGKTYYNELIDKANTVPILNIFRYYNVPINEFSIKTTCPFPSHKGGRERTPSFWYYAETNTFFCFGCNKGGGPCLFVSYMEGVSKTRAAQKIIELFGQSIGEIDAEDPGDFYDKMDLMLSFSNKVREFRSKFLDENSYLYIEGICKIYDDKNKKHKINTKALRSIVNNLIEQIDLYECKQ